MVKKKIGIEIDVDKFLNMVAEKIAEKAVGNGIFSFFGINSKQKLEYVLRDKAIELFKQDKKLHDKLKRNIRDVVNNKNFILDIIKDEVRKELMRIFGERYEEE